MISPATSGLDTDWMDEFMAFCDALNCRIDYIGAHLYKAPNSGTGSGSVDGRMEALQSFSERYGKKLWLTETAMANEANETKIVEFVEEFLPRLEHADFVHKYSWYYTRYYEDHDHDLDSYFWLDSYNSLLEDSGPTLSAVGKAFDHPWHLEKYKPN